MICTVYKRVRTDPRLIYIQNSTFSEIPINRGVSAAKPPKRDPSASASRVSATKSALSSGWKEGRKLRLTIRSKQRRFRLLIRVFLYLRLPRENLTDWRRRTRRAGGGETSQFSLVNDRRNDAAGSSPSFCGSPEVHSSLVLLVYSFRSFRRRFTPGGISIQGGRSGGGRERRVRAREAKLMYIPLLTVVSVTFYSGR